MYSTPSNPAMPAGVCKPPSIASRACAICSGVNLRGRPHVPPFFGGRDTASTRSTINARSNLGQRTHHVKNERATRCRRVDAFRQRREPPRAHQAGASVPIRCGRRAARAGPLSTGREHRRSRSGKRRIKTWSVCRHPRHAAILEHLGAPVSRQRCRVQGKRLLVGRDAGVADFHGWICNRVLQKSVEPMISML